MSQKTDEQLTFLAKNWVILCLLMVAAGIAFVVYQDHVQKQKKGAIATKPTSKPVTGLKTDQVASSPALVDPIKKYRAVAQEYYNLHNHDDIYWLKGDEGFQESMLLTQQFEKRMQELMKKNMDASALAQRIYASFKDFKISMFANGISQTMFTGKFDPNNPILPDSLEVCIIPQKQVGHPTLLPTQLYYRNDWHALMARAIDFSDAFYAAWLYHEMGHALRDKVDKSIFPDGSKGWYWEEVEMHDLESNVLDHASNGGLSKILDKIIDRVLKKKSKDQVDTPDILSEVTIEDLKQFDRVFQLEGLGREAASITFTQFIFALGFRIIDKHTPLQFQKDHKIRFYKQVSGRS